MPRVCLALCWGRVGPRRRPATQPLVAQQGEPQGGLAAPESAGVAQTHHPNTHHAAHKRCMRPPRCILLRCDDKALIVFVLLRGLCVHFDTIWALILLLMLCCWVVTHTGTSVEQSQTSCHSDSHWYSRTVGVTS